jgi:DnaK suppressor protein
MKETLDLESIRRELEAQHAALLDRIENELGPDAVQKDVNPDRYDLAQTYDRKQRDLSLLEQAERCLEQIEQALKRLEGGTYGACINCGGAITPGRLEALPYAELCINCQRQQEH